METTQPNDQQSAAGNSLRPAPVGSLPRGLGEAGAAEDGAACRPVYASFVSLVVHGVFFVSGLAALLYQIIWQRSLLMLYGSNVESVAMVVAAFMVGLGLGSLGGGAVSKRPGAPLVLLFSATELAIGLYGLGSLHLFHLVGRYTTQVDTLATGLLAFALVCVPTLFMGATLPLLVAYRVNTTGHVGQSVSWLYFVNTLGGGVGAFLAAFIILGRLGMSGSVQLAALLNFLSAAAILATWKLGRRAA
jgi:predicted membrane-bound spermidine synthase